MADPKAAEPAAKRRVRYEVKKKLFRDGKLLEPGDSFEAEEGLISRADAFAPVTRK